MTNRERALNILHYKSCDRLPAVHFGYWDELLIEWANEGHITMEQAMGWHDSNDISLEIDKLLGWDFDWANAYCGDRGLKPFFEEKILDKLPDGCNRIQNVLGLIERVKPGVNSIPAEDDYQLKDRKAWEELYLPKLIYSEDRLTDKDIEVIKQKIAVRDVPVTIFVGSVLGAIRSMLSVIGMSYMICDDYELFGEIIDTYADLQYKVTEKLLKSGIKFDCAHYWEDICFKNGPLISPTMFDELCAKHYKKRYELLKRYGIDITFLDCDGVVDRLLPIWFENGVNTMFPIEVGVWGDQFEPARKKFGKGMLGVGGMDKTALRKDKNAVDEEIERMKRLVALGGFIPCPDHRLMPGTKWELVQYYAEEIKNIKL